MPLSKLARFRRKAALPPATSRGQAPGAWHAAEETYALVALNYKSVARVGAVPLLIVGTLQAIYAIYPTLMNLLLTVFGNLAATGMFAVGLQQMVASSVQHQLYRFRFANKHWRIAAAVGLVMIPVILLSLGILALGYVLAQNILAPTALGALLLVAIVAGLALAAYTAVRFSVIMPAIALDEPIDLQSAVRATRGRAWQLWRGLLATLSPVLLIAVALSFYAARTGSAAWAASSLQGFTVITAVPLSVVFLTLSYFRYVRVGAKPKMKIIGEPSWYLRAWYEVQRVFLLLGKTGALLMESLAPKPRPAVAPVSVRTAPRATAARTQARPSPQPTPRRTARPAATPAARPDGDKKPELDKKTVLARQVAEKLVDLEEEKLAQLAALLEGRGQKSAAAAPQSGEMPAFKISATTVGTTKISTAKPLPKMAAPKPDLKSPSFKSSGLKSPGLKAAGLKSAGLKPAPAGGMTPPLRRPTVAARDAAARKLNDMLAANENGEQEIGTRD